jgi:hypothetical protein
MGMEVSNTILASIDLSVASTNSLPFRVESQIYTAIQAVWTGTAPVGVLKVQASCDAGTDQIGTGVSNWSDIASGGSLNPTTLAVSGATGSGLLEIKDAGYKWIRLVYTKTSGVGTLVPTINSKGF